MQMNEIIAEEYDEEAVHKQFIKDVVEKFGEKVNVRLLSFSQDSLDRINAILIKDRQEHQFDGEFKPLTNQDFENYGEMAWLQDGEHCPQCGAKLLGLFGSLQWTVRHGVGQCSECGQVEFRYYHYVGENQVLMQILAVVGFQ